MDQLSYKTISANKQTVQKEWVLVDAENQTVGRLATRVANILRGKTKPCFTPHVDCGDNVIIINAEKIVFTGKKMTERSTSAIPAIPAASARPPLQRFSPAIPSASSNTPSAACFLRTVLATPCTATSMCMPVPSIPTRVRTPKSSILTTLDKNRNGSNQHYR